MERNLLVGRNWPVWLLSGCLFLTGCGQSRNQAAGAPPLARNTSLPDQVDSSNAVAQDGLDFTPLNKGTYRQLPAPLTIILNRHFPGWSLPEIPSRQLKQNKRNYRGPYYVAGDFDRNGRQDYAVQFQQNDSILVAAFLTFPGSPARYFSLAKSPAGKKKASLFLGMEKAGSRIRLEKGMTELDRDGISLAQGAARQLYLFDGEVFVPLKRQTKPQ